jgi:hypothetical protein
MKALFLKEPVILTSLLKAILICAVAFGAPLTTSQTEALLGVAGAVLALGAVARQLVVPVAKLGD